MSRRTTIHKIIYPIVSLALLLLVGSWLYQTEAANPSNRNGDGQTGELDRNFNSDDKTIIKERHIGAIKLDTIKMLIAQIGWDEKIKVRARSDKASFLLESDQDKGAFEKIFFNGMTQQFLEARRFEADPIFELYNQDDEYGFMVKYFEEDDVEYVEFPFEFLLGITDERDRQKAGN